MSVLKPVNIDQVDGLQRELFGEIDSAFGAVPNMFKVIGNSPAALQSMFGSFQALGAGAVTPALGEQIAVYVANLNKCAYCLAAHTALGLAAGLSAEQLLSAQSGESDDVKTRAALDFAGKLVNGRGQVERADVQTVRDAGFGSDEIAEILAHVALNIFTNYTNVAFEVEVDFPKVEFV